MGIFGNLFRSPTELDIVQIHPRGFPNLDEILSYDSNLVQISSHFIIHKGKPVGDPETECGVCARVGAFVNVDGFEKALGNVHSAGCPQFLFGNAFFAYREDAL
eukprot:CCRYP_018710-RB/>CCRYP_018710-RB protein AED:0.47 eAED:1.00 QI:0/0/0/1/0/0/2/0/103